VGNVSLYWESGLRNLRDRIVSFDLLRAASALYIAFWHIDDYANNILFSTIGSTLTLGALSIFTFMSGFLLAAKHNKSETLNDAWNFLVKRAFRIYPLYLFALLLFLLTSQISFKSFINSVFLLNVLLNIPLRTLWFIPMIFCYYLLIPVLLYNYSTRRTILIGSFLFFIIALLHRYFMLVDIRVMYYLLPFILGVCCGKDSLLYKFIKNKKVIAISIISVALAAYASQHYIKFFYIDKISTFVCILMWIPFLVAFAEFLADKFTPKFLLRASHASFCMYLYHRIIYWSLIKAYHPPTNALTIFYLACIGVPLVFVISEFLQTGYDRLTHVRHKNSLK